MNRKALEAPFARELVKTRKGSFGQRLSYVEGIEYIRRLNDAFDGAWSFEIASHQVLENEVIVLGKLLAGGVAKQAFGGSAVTRTREAAEVVSVADDLKAATTDSLKKCCSMLGIGLHLYGTEAAGRADARPSTPTRPRDNGGNGNGRKRPGNGGGNKNQSRPTALTQRQLSAIWSLAREAGYTAQDIRAKTHDMFAASPEYLSKVQASELLSDLSDELGGNGAGAR